MAQTPDNAGVDYISKLSEAACVPAHPIALLHPLAAGNLATTPGLFELDSAISTKPSPGRFKPKPQKGLARSRARPPTLLERSSICFEAAALHIVDQRGRCREGESTRPLPQAGASGGGPPFIPVVQSPDKATGL